MMMRSSIVLILIFFSSSSANVLQKIFKKYNPCRKYTLEFLVNAYGKDKKNLKFLKQLYSYGTHEQKKDFEDILRCYLLVQLTRYDKCPKKKSTIGVMEAFGHCLEEIDTKPFSEKTIDTSLFSGGKL